MSSFVKAAITATAVGAVFFALSGVPAVADSESGGFVFGAGSQSGGAAGELWGHSESGGPSTEWGVGSESGGAAQEWGLKGESGGPEWGHSETGFDEGAESQSGGVVYWGSGSFDE
jgi:hypothetical protein